MTRLIQKTNDRLTGKLVVQGNNSEVFFSDNWWFNHSMLNKTQRRLQFSTAAVFCLYNTSFYGFKPKNLI